MCRDLFVSEVLLLHGVRLRSIEMRDKICAWMHSVSLRMRTVRCTEDGNQQRGGRGSFSDRLARDVPSDGPVLKAISFFLFIRPFPSKFTARI